MDAVIYARYSPRPDGSRGESIELQVEHCTSYCKMKGWPVIATFDDRAISGSQIITRQGFKDAMDLACEKQAVIVVYNLSRFARNTADALFAFERLQKSQADLASLKEGIDTASPYGKFIFTIMSALAELERQQIAERTSDAMKRLQDKGYRMSSNPPYGYAVDPEDGRLITPCPEEQNVIAKIVTKFKVSSLSLNAIAKWLDQHHIKNRKKNSWTAKQVQRILIREGLYQPNPRVPLAQRFSPPPRDCGSPESPGSGTTTPFPSPEDKASPLSDLHVKDI